jgi:serine/threonine-protein kinase
MSPFENEGVPGGVEHDALIGRLIDNRYRIGSVLGRGGVGVVYRAEHVKLRRDVAVKVLQREVAAKTEHRRRFEREAQVMAALQHPHIVQVTDFGLWAGLPYIVMELLEGRTLKEWLDEGPLPLETALEVSRQLLGTVAFAHNQGLIHRDLKPGNVMLRTRPDAAIDIAILDFGFAKFVNDEAGSFGPQLTVSGVAFGTPSYISPEQAMAKDVDARADLYAVGVSMFEMFAGRKPFEGDPLELLRAHVTAPRPRFGEVAAHLRVGPEVDAFFEKALARDREERFQTADEMLLALERDLVPPGGAKGRGRAHTIALATDAAATAPSPGPAAAVVEWLADRFGQERSRLILVLALYALVVVFVATCASTVSICSSSCAAAAPESVVAAPP